MFNVLLCFVTLVMVNIKYKNEKYIFCVATYNIFFVHFLFTASNSSGRSTTYPPDGTVVQQPADSGEVAYYVIAGLAIATAVISGVSII